jgi:hypothetical protein
MTNRVTETAGRAGAYASDKLHSAADTVRDTASTARTTASDALGTAREKTAQGIDDGPIAALIGGLALGALAGALLPVTRKEAETLGPIGSRINDATKNAVSAAREAGTQSLTDMGVKDTARSKVRELVETAVEAARTASKSASTAAVQAVKKPGETV